MRGINLLSDREVKAFKGPGRLSDGGGLYWNGATWAFLYTFGGRRREMGFGAMSLAAARGLAGECRDQVASGVDPIEARKADRATGVTFSDVANETFAVLKAKWRHVEREKIKWDNAIKACSSIASLAVKGITVEDIRVVLKPFDDRVPQKRFILSVIRRVFDTAVAKGLREGNPAVARIMGRITTLDHKHKHNAAMQYEDVPAFVHGLRAKVSQGAKAARCLEFIILTGVRKTEATQMRFSEVDLGTAVWTIPAGRMKANRLHTVPLTDRALTIIRDQRALTDGDFVFPQSSAGRRVGGRAVASRGITTSPDTTTAPHASVRGARGAVRGMSHGAFVHLTPEGVTVHGFRSSLRDFLGDVTDVPYETAEEVLSHRVGDRTVASYRRSSGLAKRRVALQYWADFIDGRLAIEDWRLVDGVPTKNVNQADNVQ
ncbi:tyrosine-type recombinase/integrase [Mesorhizobium sp. B4-1-4]|uniref:tyrosine-type recombinase/integrase n=1 Tax=Mesorhizobium sp. B4-1-4 TaxID=2589888 RepID=UPI0011294257|nr:site-specific integrase [Mesorhizobium sp. B4-1-4]UCI32523.1 site-specific integrase [Mesorhizobium sp. B4-1-4]